MWSCPRGSSPGSCTIPRRARQDFLVRLLDLGIFERVGERARRLAAETKVSIELLEGERRRLAWATREQSWELRESLERVTAFRRLLKERLPVLAETAAALDQTETRAQELERQARACHAVRVPEQLARQAERLEASRQEAQRATERAEATVREAEEASRRQAGLMDRESLFAARESHRRLLELRDETPTATAERDRLAQELQDRTESLHRCEEHEREASEKLARTVQAHQAHALARQLEPGQPCPVCGSSVEKKPRHRAPASLKREEKAAAAAAQARDDARRDRDRLEERLKAGGLHVEELETRCESLQRELEGTPHIEAVEDQLTQHARREEERQRLARAVTAAQREALERSQEARELSRWEESSWAELTRRRDPLVSLGPPSRESADLLSAWTELSRWAEREAGRLRAEAERLRQTEAERRERHRRDLEGLQEQARSHGVSASSLEGLEEAAVGAEARLKQRLEDLEIAQKDARGLDGRIKKSRRELKVATRLGQLLSARHLEQWLVAEAWGLLLADASQILGDLSSGQFSLRSDPRGEIRVIDHRYADEERSVRTLSGGETFQASLALALALADRLSTLSPHGSHKLDAIFLDEGFGSLDPDALEVVANTIETLAGSDRMVGLVTHVPALAQRVPVRYEVSKGPRSSTVSRVTG